MDVDGEDDDEEDDREDEGESKDTTIAKEGA
jgi:hypothetical protein